MTENDRIATGPSVTVKPVTGSVKLRLFAGYYNHFDRTSKAYFVRTSVSTSLARVSGGPSQSREGLQCNCTTYIYVE